MNDERKNILIVDDDTMILQYILRTLVSRCKDRYKCCVAVDGYEALDIINTKSVDCVILDLHMSNLNGLEVIDRMKENQLDIATNIVVSSGHIDESMEMELQALGIKNYLKKPYPISHLIEVVDHIYFQSETITPVS